MSISFSKLFLEEAVAIVQALDTARIAALADEGWDGTFAAWRAVSRLRKATRWESVR